MMDYGLAIARERRGGAATLLLRLAIAVLSLAAAALLCVVVVPEAVMRAWAKSLTPDGDPRFLTPEFIRSLKLGCGFAAAGVLASAIALGTWWRGVAERGLRFLLEDAAAFRRELAAGCAVAMRGESAIHKIALAVVLLAAVAVRLFYLAQPMRHDEARTFLSFASHSPADFLSNYWAPNNHVLHTFFMHVSWLLFGDHPVALRLPAFAAGCLMIPLAYVCARRLFGANAAIVAAALLAGWPAAIEYSVNARGYTMVGLFLLAVFVLATYLRDRPSFTGWALFVCCAVLGMHTVPIMLYGLGAAGIWMMISSAPERRWRVTLELAGAATSVFLLTVVVYFPVLFRSGVAAVIANPTTRPAGLEQLSARAPGFFQVIWEWWTMDIPPLLLGLMAAGLLAALLPLRGAGRATTSVLAAMLLFVVPFGLIHGRLPPPRVAFVLLPILIAVTAGGFAALVGALAGTTTARRLCAAAAVACVAFLGLHQTVTRDEVGLTRDAYSDVEQAVAFLRPALRAGDVAVARFPASGPLEFYLRRAGIDKSFFHKFDHNEEDQVIVNWQRVFIVIQPERYGLDDFEVDGLDWKSQFQPPRVFADFGSSQILVFEKTPLQAAGQVPAEVSN